MRKKISIALSVIVIFLLGEALFPVNQPEYLAVFAAGFYLLFWTAVLFFSGMERSKVFLLAIVSSVSLALAILLIEALVLFRVADFRIVFGNYVDEPWKNPHNRLDPVLLHIHRPHTEFQGVQPTGDIGYYYAIENPNQYPYHVEYDGLGFRNRDTPTHPDIVVIGDSFIEAATVSYDDTMVRQLETVSGRSTANLGQLWYGPQQELEVLRRFALEMKPQVVVWMFFAGNDLSDFRRYEEAQAHWAERSPGFHSFIHRSFSKNAFLTAYRFLGSPPAKKAAPFCEIGDGERVYFYYREPRLEGENAATLKKVKHTLLTAAEETHAAGAKFLAVYIPTKIRVYFDHCLHKSQQQFKGWSESRLPKILQTTLAQTAPDAAFLDLTPALASAVENGEDTYFSDDTHWTVQGNRVAAMAVARMIEDEMPSKADIAVGTP